MNIVRMPSTVFFIRAFAILFIIILKMSIWGNLGKVKVVYRGFLTTHITGVRSI